MEMKKIGLGGGACIPRAPRLAAVVVNIFTDKKKWEG